MNNTLSLNGPWQLTYAEGSNLVRPEFFMGAEVRGRQLLTAQVPSSVHQTLMEAGLLDDPNLGMNSLKARWVEEMFWVYRRTFTVPAEAVTQTAWLVFDRLDCCAVILLNGEEIGRHANAFSPARFNVTGKLREGDNLLVVQVEAGMHALAGKDAAPYSMYQVDNLTKRPFLRKPQYQTGWDWHPRLMNVGILGDVRLEWRTTVRLDQVSVYALPNDDLSAATVHVQAHIQAIGDEPVQGTLRATIVKTGATTEIEITLPHGDSRLALTLEIANPRLWWPVGHGEQHRYTVEVMLIVANDVQSVTRKTGVRKVAFDESPHPVEGNYCILTINNRPIFCKGGNWVPPDIFYSAVPEERTRQLVALAVDANFNLLRVWGGGVYADAALCDACDEVGIMLWHDFMFACASYPADDLGFIDEVEREAAYQLREKAHHPSIVVWCGNNEIDWMDWETTNWLLHVPPTQRLEVKNRPHHVLFHFHLPKLVHDELPSVVYRPCSPYSPDYRHPNDPLTGDQHPWTVSLFTAGGADWWKYRTHIDRFANEGGVLGASLPVTLRQFLPEDEQYLRSASWDHHDNTCGYVDLTPGAVGHVYSTVELWTGRDPLTMSLDEFAIISGLLQAEGISEYITNYRRRMFDSACAVFWMYNDSWPTTTSWTIVDYYLRKKLAYHPVRRACQPVTVVVADEGETIVVYGVNDTPQDWLGTLHTGIVGLQGGYPVEERLAVSLPANASTRLWSVPRAEWDAIGTHESAVFARMEQHGVQIAMHRLFVERFKDVALTPDPVITITEDEHAITLQSDVFVWGVCLDLTDESSVADNAFDLLPGIPVTLPWSAVLGTPYIYAVGNHLLLMQHPHPV